MAQICGISLSDFLQYQVC